MGSWESERPDELDLLLVGPRGQKVVLMSDACGPLGVSGFGWTWDDEAAAPMPEGLRPGTKYKAVVTTGARDLAGNRLHQSPGVAGSQPKVGVFTTKS